MEKGLYYPADKNSPKISKLVLEEDVFPLVTQLSPLHVNWDREWFPTRHSNQIVSIAHLSCVSTEWLGEHF